MKQHSQGLRVVESVKDKSEFTYGVHPGRWYQEFGTRDICVINMKEWESSKVLASLGEAMMGASRSIIAETDLLLQGIAYCPPVKVVKEGEHFRVKIGVYLRNKRNNEGQLSQKLSIGLGGHIEQVDARPFAMVDPDGHFHYTGTLDLFSMLRASALREIHEEASFGEKGWDGIFNDGPVGFVKDGAEFSDKPGYVGNHHFGAIYPFQVRPDADFTMVEVNNDALGWFDAADLRLAEAQTGAKFEPWSQLIVKEILSLSQDPQVISGLLLTLWRLDPFFEGKNELTVINADNAGDWINYAFKKDVVEVDVGKNVTDPVGCVAAFREEFHKNYPELHKALSSAGLSVPQVVDAIREASLTIPVKKDDQDPVGTVEAAREAFSSAKTHYTPSQDEPSPFGPKTVNYKPNAWINWHQLGGKSFHEIKGVRYTGGAVVFLEEVIKTLEAEVESPKNYRPSNLVSTQEPRLLTSTGDLSLDWVIWAFYVLGASSWEKAHSVGMARREEFMKS